MNTSDSGCAVEEGPVLNMRATRRPTKVGSQTGQVGRMGSCQTSNISTMYWCEALHQDFFRARRPLVTVPNASLRNGGWQSRFMHLENHLFQLTIAQFRMRQGKQPCR